MRRILQLILVWAALGGAGAAAAQSEPTFQFDIPSTDLASAIQRFASTIGGDAVFDAYAARNVRTQPVRGSMTPESALGQMFAGSGLNYHYNAAARRIVVGRGAATPPARVPSAPAPAVATPPPPQPAWPEVVPAPAPR